MSLRVVPTRVRSAISTVETERERITTERDALSTFLDRVSDLDVLTGDRHSDQARYPPARSLVTPERAGHATSSLACVRDAYRDTVMSVPHYQDDYGDTLPESLAEEFGHEIATAVMITIGSRLLSETSSSTPVTKLARAGTPCSRA